MRTDFEPALFSIKCFVAAMLAYYVALRIGLQNPYWAVTTSYIVAQPLAGAVLSKAVFRGLGTMLGAAAAVVLVPTFVNEPLVLGFALAVWLGVCAYIAQLDRTPRAYVFVLAGYTASIIGFPSVDMPGTIFTTAILRVQEIMIGLLCGSLIHGVVFPRTVTDRLHARIDEIIAEVELRTRGALALNRDAAVRAERRRIALDLGELDQLSAHLPFDTARLVPRTRTVRALQDQLIMMLPLVTTVEDRLEALEDCPGGIPAAVADLTHRTSLWLESGVAAPDRDATAAALIAEAAALEPERRDTGLVWRDMLLFNLLSRLAELIAAHRDCRNLRDQLRSPSTRAITPEIGRLLARAHGRSLHLDRGAALRTGLGTVATIMIGCVIWIGISWPEGGGAVLIAGVCCALFGSGDNGPRTIRTFLYGTTMGIFTAVPYAYAIMPRVTDFVMLAAVLAPALLLLGSVFARPQFQLLGFGTALGFLNTVGLSAHYAGDFASFVNGSVAQLLGVAFSVVTVSLFQTVGPETAIGRLFRSGWRDVARRASGRSRDELRWLSRMIDRIGLLLPKLPGRPEDDTGRPLIDMLIDMRIGIVTGRLRAIGREAPPAEHALVDRTLDAIGDYYQALHPRRPVPPPDDLLADIDRTVAAFADDPVRERRRNALLLLTSLRRNLFPAAPGYGAAA
jgi:uncharacterized membrane protein YccC